MSNVIINSIAVLLIATCLSTNAMELGAMRRMSGNALTGPTNRNGPKYTRIGLVYMRVEWRRSCLGKVWVPNAMQSGDLIWGAQIAILGYTLALLAFVLESLVRRAQFA